MILYLHAPNDGMPLLEVFEGPVYSTSGEVNETLLQMADWIVSYGYRHILPAKVCERFDGRAVNLHIGYLPWTRGAHPNVWSALEGSPSGVTLHYIDAGIDTGDIIAQEEVKHDPFDTYAQSYATLKKTAKALFAKTWPQVIAGTAPRTKQPHKGTFHRSKDLPELNWDDPRGIICGDVFAA